MFLVCLKESVLSDFMGEGFMYVQYIQYIKLLNYVIQIFYILSNFFFFCLIPENERTVLKLFLCVSRLVKIVL